MLAENDRAALKVLFAAYVQGRLETYSTPAYGERLFAELKKDKEMQDRIWQRTVDALRGDSTPPNAAILVPQALNEMFDVANTRARLLTAHNPPLVYLLLYASALVAGLLAGYGMDLQSRKSRVHEFGFAIVITLALYVIVDFDCPRLGLIRLDGFDRALAAQL